MSAATASPPARGKRAAAAPSTDNVSEWPFRFAIVPLKHLIVDAYQRPLTNFVDKITSNFEPALVGTLCLSERSKTKFAVIDGQTRSEGMKRLGMTEAPAIVYEDLNREQEAALFSRFQTERRGMTSASRYLAQVIAGQEPQVSIDKILRKQGFFVEHNSSEPFSLRAVAALEFVYQGTYGRKGRDREDPELLADVLDVIKTAWPGIPESAKGAVMVKGLGWFLAREPSGKFDKPRASEVQMDRLVQRLARVQPSELQKRAESLREGKGMTGNSPAYLAEAIQAQYSKHR